MENTQPLGNPALDYSGMPTPPAVQADDWETPQRKFYGKKGPNGKMLPEPPYVHIPYPAVRYAQPGGAGTQIVTKHVKDAEEDAAIGPMWKNSPAEFGYIGAPSAEQNLRLQNSQAQKMIDAQKEIDAKAIAESAAKAKYAAETEEREAKAAAEAAVDARIAEAVAKALTAAGVQQPRGPGRPRNEQG